MKKSNSSSRGSSSRSGRSKIPKLEVDKNSDVRVRKIENGFIIQEIGTIGKGRNQTYYNKEYFSDKNPIASVTKGGGSVKFGRKN